MKDPFQLTLWFHERKWNILAVFFLFVSYLVIYRDVVFAPYVITGVDFQIPARTPYDQWIGFFTSWSEFGNGFPWGTNWSSYGALLNGVFLLVSNGNGVLAQKLMMSGVFFASVFMYAFIAKHITRNRIVALTGAIIYAYGPSTVNYGTGLVWEYAFFPLVVYFLFNLLGSNPRFRDAALFVISLDLMIGYGLHLMVFLPLVAIAFFLLNLHGSHDKTDYCIRSLKFLSGSLVLFLLSAPSFTLTLLSLIPLPITIPGQALAEGWASSTTISQFYNNYGSIPFLNWFLLSGPYSEYIRPLVAVVGFVFPIVAALALIQRSHSKKLALGFSTILVLVLTFVVLIQWKTSIFTWLFYNFPPIRLLRDSGAVLFIISFSVTALISITLGELAQTIEHRWNLRLAIVVTLERAHGKLAHIIERRWNVIGNDKALTPRRLATILLSLILLLSFFLCVPAFDPQQHLRGAGYADSSLGRPVPVDSSYSLVLDWLNRQTESGTFRYQVIPSLFSATLALHYSRSPFWFAPSQSLPATSQYAYYSLGALLSNQTRRWGLILAPANIKYIVVIWNTTETDFATGATEWRATGNPLLQSGPGLSGDYRHYVDLLGAQSDLKLVVTESNYLIYENLDYLPHVEVFPSLSYIVGDLSAINDIGQTPNFSANSSMLVYGNQPSPCNPLLYADTVIFQNRNITDLALDNLSMVNGIALSSYGGTQRTAIDYSWVQAAPENNYLMVQGMPTSGLLATQNTFIETTGTSELRANFSVSSKGLYDAWLSVLFSPQSTGVMRFLIDGKPLNLTLRPNSQIIDGFEWIRLGALKLDSGQHMITIENSNGYNALSVLQIVDPDMVKQEELTLSAMLATKSITYFFDDPSLFNVAFSNTSRTLSSYNLSQYSDGNSWGNLSIISDGVVAPLSVQDAGAAVSPSLRQVLGFIFPSEDRNFSGWGYIEFWVKTSTPQTQVYLFNNLRQNVYDYYWVFSTSPGVWNRLLIPLEGNFSYIDGIQIHAVADKPGQNVTIELNQINLVNMDTNISIGAYLPVDKVYSIDYIVSQAPIAPTLVIDGKPVPVTIVNGSSVYSFPVYLASGYHNFTVSVSGVNFPQGLTIRSGNWDMIYGETEITNVTNFGNTEYIVNVTSYRPFYLLLGESYDNNWRAYLNGKELPHFYAYSYLNGYYINETGTISIIIQYNGQNYLTIIWLGLGVFAFLLIYVTVDTMLRRQTRKHTKTIPLRPPLTHSEG